MNLLLLLSALLSALTGVGAAVRAPQVAQAVAGASSGTAQAAPRRAVRSLHPVPGLHPIATVTAAVRAVLALPADRPIWASRRRE